MNRARPTRAQMKSIYQLFQRSSDGSPTYREFRKRFRHLSFGNIFGGTWHGMFIGIETDGYRHS
jgi:Ca2+-binding EF-hand superfamily protein